MAAPFWRIEIAIRNISNELPGAAQGTLTIDFADLAALATATASLVKGLENPLNQTLVITNEAEESVGFNPHHYSFHFVRKEKGGYPEGPRVRWALPGRSAPEIENPGQGSGGG